MDSLHSDVWSFCIPLLLLLAPDSTMADHSIVGVPPYFAMEPPASRVVNLIEFTVVDGTQFNLVLPCEVRGTPTPTISWFRGTEQLESSAVLPDGRLAINVTTETASRAGTVYYCVATNRIGPNSSITAALRSRDVNVSHAYFDGFRQAEYSVSHVKTVLAGSVALECDFINSNPHATVQWFMGTLRSDINVPVNPIPARGEILYLEGGRYLYFRKLTAEQRQMRYQCEVSTEFMSATRAPTIYTINTDITAEGLTVYRPLGTHVVEVGTMNEIIFVLAAVVRQNDGTASEFFGVSNCHGITNVLTFSIAQSFALQTTLSSAPPSGQSEVVFTCSLSGGGQDGVKINGTVIVSDPPEFMVSDQTPGENDREVVVGGGAVVYSCEASGVPAPTTTWYYNGRQELGSEVVIASTLIIAKPQINDSGIYQCVVSNQFGVIRRRWTLEVREPVFPVISSLVATSGAVPDRQLKNLVVRPANTTNVVISVVVEADPCPTVMWKFEGRDCTVEINASTEEFILANPCRDGNENSPYNFTLTIASLTSGTSGVYSANFTVLNTVVPLPSLFVTVHEESAVRDLEVKLETDDPNPPDCLLEGSNVIFTCVVDGFPRPQIIFRKDTTVIEPNMAPDFIRVESIFPDQIRISNVTATDQGVYSCEAAEGRAIASMQIFCTKPAITAFTATESLQQGSELMIECVVSGTPTPMVVWRKDNVTLNGREDVLLTISPHDQIRIRAVSPEDSGVYSCQTTNLAGTTVRSMNIEIYAGSMHGAPTTDASAVPKTLKAIAIGIVIAALVCGVLLYASGLLTGMLIKRRQRKNSEFHEVFDSVFPNSIAMKETV